MRIPSKIVFPILLSASVCLAHTPATKAGHKPIVFVDDTTEYSVREIFSRYCSGEATGAFTDISASGKDISKFENRELSLEPMRSEFMHTGLVVNLEIGNRSHGSFWGEPVLIPSEEADRKIRANQPFHFAFGFNDKGVETSIDFDVTLQKGDDGELYLRGRYSSKRKDPRRAFHVSDNTESTFLCRLDPTRERYDKRWGTPVLPTTHEVDVNRFIEDVKAGKDGVEGYHDLDSDGLQNKIRAVRVPGQDIPQKIEELYRTGHKPDPAQLTGKSREIFEKLQAAGLKPILAVRQERSFSVPEGAAAQQWKTETGREHRKEAGVIDLSGPKLNIYVETDKSREQGALLKDLRRKTAEKVAGGSKNGEDGFKAVTYEGPIAEYRKYTFFWGEGRLNWSPEIPPNPIDNSKMEIEILKHAEPN